MVCNKIPSDRIIKGFIKLGTVKYRQSENNMLWKKNKTLMIQNMTFMIVTDTKVAC